MSIATTTPSVTDYVRRIQDTNPQEAVQIALAEVERERALAAQEQAHYRAMAEVEFDDHGRIAKANLAGLYRLAQAYSRSQIVPDHYQNKPDNCFIACQMAVRLKVDPLAYMQNSYIVHGKPGIEAKLSTALLNTSGLIRGRIRYEEQRDRNGKMVACTAIAIDADSGEEVRATVTWQMAEAEGWVNKSGSKWKTIPDVMFHYRSATFLIRQFYPEVMMGMQTVDELNDIGPANGPSNGCHKPKSLAEMTERLLGNSPSNADSEPAADQNTIEGRISEESHEPTIDTDLITRAREWYASADTVAKVDQLEKELAGDAQTDEERSALAGMADERREALAASKPKGRQKSFAE